jgi:hypothetical protein
VTAAFTSGSSVTCRRIIPASAAPARPPAHREQQAGSCRTTRSGQPLSCIVTPGCPFGLPGLRPVFFRSDFGAGFARPPTLAAAWHHAYGGQRPDLGRALEFYDRWLPGTMRRIATITRTCVPECVTRRRPW